MSSGKEVEEKGTKELRQGYFSKLWYGDLSKKGRIETERKNARARIERLGNKKAEEFFNNGDLSLAEQKAFVEIQEERVKNLRERIGKQQEKSDYPTREKAAAALEKQFASISKLADLQSRINEANHNHIEKLGKEQQKNGHVSTGAKIDGGNLEEKSNTISFAERKKATIALLEKKETTNSGGIDEEPSEKEFVNKHKASEKTIEIDVPTFEKGTPTKPDDTKKSYAKALRSGDRWKATINKRRQEQEQKQDKVNSK